MTESLSAADAGPPPDSTRNDSTLIRVGGILGFVATSVGLAIFLLGCAGYDWGFAFYWLPLVLAGAGMLVTIVGGVLRHGGVEHTSIIANLFLNLFGLVGGLFECALFNGWDIFARHVSS